MQNMIEDTGVTAVHYRCSSCPNPCDVFVRSTGCANSPAGGFKIRQVCMNFKSMDGNTSWEKLA